MAEKQKGSATPVALPVQQLLQPAPTNLVALPQPTKPPGVEDFLGEKPSGLSALDRLACELAKEVDALEKVRESRYSRSDTSQISTRRVTALTKLADIMMQREKLLAGGGGGDRNTLLATVDFFVSKLVETLQDLKLEEATAAKVMETLQKKTEFWEREVNQRVTSLYGDKN